MEKMILLNFPMMLNVTKHESKKTVGTQGRSLKTKAPVFGMVQRSGNVVAVKTEDTKGKTLM